MKEIGKLEASNLEIYEMWGRLCEILDAIQKQVNYIALSVQEPDYPELPEDE